ncbi:MAG: hypothetical protein M3256_04835 [Actinomycetota bacterium]|nr:hypothetical protein [Candidatus Dormibacteraeota bacterium]MDQ6945598.1 hypothetical protein [Actinomycetota bacterium]
MARTLHLMRDIMDSQMVSADGKEIGRVADIAGEMRADGSVELTHILTGPEALTGRVGTLLRPAAKLILHGRFEASIPLTELMTKGLTLRLKQDADAYRVGDSEGWIAEHILRFIPGSGYRAWKERLGDGRTGKRSRR